MKLRRDKKQEVLNETLRFIYSTEDIVRVHFIHESTKTAGDLLFSVSNYKFKPDLKEESGIFGRS